jgi:hypothetical protein
MKKLIFLLLLCIPLVGFSQGPFKGFFKPINDNVFPARYFMQRGENIPGKWLFRPAISITAIQLNWNKTTKQFDASALNQAGLGIGYQHFIDNSGTPYNDFGVNALLLLGADQGNGSMSFALTGSFLQYCNVGCLYNFSSQSFGILTGVTLKF